MAPNQGPRNSLYRSLALFTTGLLILAGTLQFLLLFPCWKLARQAVLQKQNLHLAEEVASRLKPLYLNNDVSGTLQTVYRFIYENPNTSLFLLDSTGAVLADYAQGMKLLRKQIPLTALKRFERAEKSEIPITAPDSMDADEEQLFSLAPLPVAGESFWVYLVLDSDASRSSFNVLREGYAIAAGGAGVLFSTVATGLLAVVILYFVTRRFSGMTDVVREYARGDFRRRLDVSSRRDELDDYAVALNRMAEKIKSDIVELGERDQTRRRLIRAVSEDLIVPMKEMEPALQDLEIEREGRISGDASVIFEQSKAMAAALDELFELARIESKDSMPHLEEFSFVHIIDDVLIAKMENAVKHDVAIAPAWEASLRETVLGDISWIEAAVGAVLDELLDRSQPGARITIFVEKMENRLEAKFELRGTTSKNYFSHQPESSLRTAIIAAKLKAHQSGICRQISDDGTTSLSFSLCLTRCPA